MVGSASIKDESNVPVLLLDEETPDGRPDAPAIRHEPSMRQRSNELDAEVSIVPEDRMPVRSDELAVAVNRIKVFLAEPKAMSRLEDVLDLGRRDIDQFLRPDWPVIPDQLELFPGERSQR